MIVTLFIKVYSSHYSTMNQLTSNLTAARRRSSVMLMDTEGTNSKDLANRVRTLERDLQRRQESYITREREYQLKVEELEASLNIQRQKKTDWMNSDDKLTRFKDMQNQIIKNVESVQEKASKVLRDQEKDLLRSFQTRLFNLQEELVAERNKRDDGSMAWIEKCKRLESEFEWSKEISSRLEESNSKLIAENTRLKAQHATQEEDRGFLVKQVSATKKENARLKTENGQLASEVESLKKEVSNCMLIYLASLTQYLIIHAPTAGSDRGRVRGDRPGRSNSRGAAGAGESWRCRGEV